VRAVDYSADGSIVGVEFSDASRQMGPDSAKGLPNATEVEAALRKAGVIR
jgi:hypothetical protein